MAWTLPDATGALVDIPVTSRLRCNDLEVIADTAVDGMGLPGYPTGYLWNGCNAANSSAFGGIVQVQ